MEDELRLEENCKNGITFAGDQTVTGCGLLEGGTAAQIQPLHGFPARS